MILSMALRTAVAAISLADSAAVVLRTRDVSILVDSSRPIPPWRSWNDLPDTLFRPMERTPWRGPSIRPTLFRIPIRPPVRGRWWLVFDAGLCDLEVQWDGHRHVPSETVHSLRTRTIATEESIVPLDLTDTTVRIDLSTFDPHAQVSWERLGAKLVPDRDFPAWIESRTRFSAMVLGFSAAAFMVAMCLWLLVREAAPGWYAGYLASYILWFTFKSGFLSMRTWFATPIFSCLAIGGFCLFLASFLGLRRTMRTAARILHAVAALNVLVAFAGALETSGIAPEISWTAMTIPLQFSQFGAFLCILVILARRSFDDRLALKLLLACFPLLVAVVYGGLVEMGQCLGSYGLHRHMVVFCALLENVVTTSILAGEILRRERRRRELERSFHAKVMESSDKHRQDVARELHDDLAQQAVALRMRIHHLTGKVLSGDAFDDLDARIDNIRHGIRKLSVSLHPALLSSTGLNTALGALCADQERLFGIGIGFVGEDVSPPAPETSVHLFRIVQHAIANAVQHANPSRIDVHLERASGSLRLSIRDDGAGFVPDAATWGLGLEGMNSRSLAMGGTMKIESAPGRGTNVLVEIPDPA